MPRNKYPEQTVEKILSAAERLFAQKGYAKTTLQDIIDTTGLSKGAVYHHFKSKEEIAAKVGDRLGARVAAELARIPGRCRLDRPCKSCKPCLPVSLLPGRQQQLQHMLPHLCDDPQFFTMEYHDLLEMTVPLYITPMIRQGVADGSIQTESPEALGEAIFLLADLWLNPQTRPTTPARAARAVRGIPTDDAGPRLGSSHRRAGRGAGGAL